MKIPYLSDLPLSLKTLGFCLIITIMLGYGIGFVQIYARTTYNMKKVLIHYRGDEKSEDEFNINPPQSFQTMLSIAHVHTLSQPLMLGFIALIFCFSRKKEKIKTFFIALSFLGIVMSNGAPWLTKYGGANFIYLFPLAQLMIFISLMVMSLVSLKELCCKKSLS